MSGKSSGKNLDIGRCLAVAYNGDPRRAAAPRGTMTRPVTLVTRQLGHAVTSVRGSHRSACRIELTEAPERSLWLELSSLDQGGFAGAVRANLSSLLDGRSGTISP